MSELRIGSWILSPVALHSVHAFEPQDSKNMPEENDENSPSKKFCRSMVELSAVVIRVAGAVPKNS
jgi:hypothetical protein